MMGLAVLIIGGYLVVTGSFPGSAWGPLRGPYSGTGPWISLNPLFGRLSGAMFLLSYLGKHFSSTAFFTCIGLAFLLMIIGMIVN